jgi:hypothetical protein
MTALTGPAPAVLGRAARRDRRRLVQALGVAQAASGALLIGRPARVARAVSGSATAHPAPWLVRLLGMRLLGQGLTGALWPHPNVAAVGAAVDATHAASMIATAAVAPRYRRPALTSAACALASAAVAASTLAPRINARHARG